MSREYLKDLNDKILLDSSQIKQLIQDLPKLNTTEIQLKFSIFQCEEDKEMLCNVLGTLLKRISISARRSKQAFTSMWDSMKKFLEMVLNDALRIQNRCNCMNLVMRQILQLGIKPDEKKLIFCECNWLAMDLDTQLEKLKYSRGIEHVEDFESDLNLKTLLLYCERFQIDTFPKTFLRLLNPTAGIIDLFFKKYYDHQVICEYIELKEKIPIEIIINLKALPTSEWLKFPCSTIEILISKIMSVTGDDTKKQAAVFELLSEIADSLDYRSDNLNSLGLAVIVNGFEIMNQSDTVLSKYWSFVSACLSSERVRDYITTLEPKIFKTLHFESMIKAKISVCRVISLYWDKLNDKSSVFEILLNCSKDHPNNKLKWNLAASLMNYECSQVEFKCAKVLWLREIQNVNNYKVMYSWTNLLLNWSVLYQYDLISDPEDENTIWMCLNHLKSFICENNSNLECEDGENIVESARKLETVLKSILIGPNFERGLN